MQRQPVRQAAPGVPTNFHHRGTTTGTQDHEDHQQGPSTAGRADAVGSQSPSDVDARRRTYSPTQRDDDTGLVRHVTHCVLPVCLFRPTTAAKTACSLLLPAQRNIRTA